MSPKVNFITTIFISFFNIIGAFAQANNGYSGNMESRLTGKTWKVKTINVDNIPLKDSSFYNIRYDFLPNHQFVLYSLPNKAVSLKWSVDEQRKVFSIYKDKRLDQVGKILQVDSSQLVIAYKLYDNTLGKERDITYVMIPE